MNPLLLTINLLIVSSLAILNLDRVFPQALLNTITNNPPANLIAGKWIAFFDPVCVQNSNTDVIGDFVGLFNCYTTDTSIVDLYPDIVSTFIYMDQNLNCPQLLQTADDLVSINYNAYCFIGIIPDQEYETFGTDCIERTVSNDLYNLDTSSPPENNNKFTYIDYDPLYDPNVDIIIMDSGVEFNHIEFTGITTSKILDTFPGDAYDDHGSHVAGTVVGKTFGAFRAENTNIKLIDVRVFPTNGGTSSANILNGYQAIIDYLESNPGKKAIINMSFGGGNNAQFNARLREIRQAGGISFAAAGNSDGDARNFSPASSIDTITVGALDDEPNVDERASFSNYDPDRSNGGGGGSGSGSLIDLLPLGLGSVLDVIFGPGGDEGMTDDRLYVDVWAPGVRVRSVINGPNNNENGLKSGTSMASPLAAGIAANILANNPTFTFADINQTLIDNAIKDVDDLEGRTGLPRVQATCNQYCNHVNPNAECPLPLSPAALDIPEMIGNEYYDWDNYYNHDNEKENYNYNYNPEINYKPGVKSTGMSQYMVEGFVITLLMILICFIVLYCNQKGDDEMNKGYNSFKMVEI